MTLDELLQADLSKIDDEELLNLHRRTHQWIGASVDPKLVRKAHVRIVAEMLRRGLAHRSPLESVRSAAQRGLYLVRPHGRLIWLGLKKAIVKSRPFDLAGEWIIVSKEEGEGLAFGKARLGQPEVVDLEEFDRRFREHRVTRNERIRWWPDATKLYLYPIEDFRPFRRPKKVEVEPGVQTVISEIRFIEEKSEERVDRLLEQARRLPDRIVLIPEALSIIGSQIYARDREPNDFDLLLRAETDDRGHFLFPLGAGAGLKLERLFADIFGAESISYTNETTGPNWRYLPLYDLALVLRPELEIREVNEPEFAALEYKAVRQPFGIVGGKHYMARKLAQLMPEHKIYVEPFCGAAALFWHKEPSPKEVLGDIDPEIIFIFRFLRDASPEQLRELSKKDWKGSEATYRRLFDSKPKNDVDRAYRFLYTAHFGWLGGSSIRTRGQFRHYDEGKVADYSLPRLLRLQERLRSVTLRRQDALKTIEEFDSPDTFFYLDPPYPLDTREPQLWVHDEYDLAPLLERLKSLKGKFLLSLDTRTGSSLELAPGWQRRLIETRHTSVGGTREESPRRLRSKVREVVIANYRLPGLKEGLKMRHLTPKGLERMLRGATPELRRQAALSLRQDRVVPGRLFVPLKPMRPARESERQLISTFFDYIAELDSWPLYVSPKRDGARHTIHRRGDKIWIFSDDGRDNTSRLPRLVERLKSFGPDTWVIDTEIEYWKGGQHYPREAAAGAIHSGDDEHLVINIFRILYWDGRDLHNEPFERVWAVMEKMDVDTRSGSVLHPSKGRINLVPHQRVENLEQLKRAVLKLAYAPGVEGVVVKRADGTYPLNGHPGTQKPTSVKWHKNVPLYVTVTERLETKTPGTYVYRYKIGDLEVGKTFGTSQRFEPGDVFLLECETLNQELDEEGKVVRLSCWVPNVIEKADKGKADSVESAVARARKHGVLQGKRRTKAGVEYLPTEPGDPATADKGLIEAEKGLRQPFGSPGGKRTLAPMLLKQLPPHETYVEPFCGAAALFWQKEPSPKEVLGDIDPDVVQTYRFLQSASEEEIARLLKFDWKGRRSTWRRLRDWKRKEEWAKVRPGVAEASDVEAVYRFLYLRHFSYSNSPDKGFSPSREGQDWKDQLEANLPKWKERLRGVTIVQADALETIRKYDSEKTFFYLDPPYPTSRPKGSPDTVDWTALVEQLKKARGKFLLSVEDSEQQLERFKEFHIYRVPVVREVDRGESRESTELLIANYPLKRMAGLLPVRSKAFEVCDNPLCDRAPEYVLEVEAVRYWLCPECTTEYQEDASRKGLSAQLIGPLDDAEWERWALEALQASEFAGAWKGLEDYPEEDQRLRFVAQNHFRGRSVHLDLRFEYRRGKQHFLQGFTVLHQMPGAIREPVLTLEQAKALSRNPRNWKMDLDTGQIKKRRIRGGVIRKGDLRAVAKAVEIPSDWLNVEGVTRRPDPGERPPVGATRHYPGVFHIVETGEVEWGAQKPWFREFFLNGKRWKGRWVFRLISRRKQEEILPPGVEEERPRSAAYWVLMQPDDQTPYVLSEEAIEKAWLPPKGVSCLPRRLRSKVPKELRYWEMDRKDALEARRRLASIEELGGPGLKEVRTAEFVLQRHYWRGQIVIRFGPSTEHFDLRVRDGKTWHLVLEGNPLADDEIAAYVKDMKPDCTVESVEGKKISPFDIPKGERVSLKPNTEANPTKATPAWLETVDTGQVRILDEKAGFVKLQFEGEKLKGLWTARAEDPRKPEGFWSFSHSEGPSLKEATMEHLLISDLAQVRSWSELEPWFEEDEWKRLGPYVAEKAGVRESELELLDRSEWLPAVVEYCVQRIEEEEKACVEPEVSGEGEEPLTLLERFKQQVMEGFEGLKRAFTSQTDVTKDEVQPSPFVLFKGLDGNMWLLTWTTNAFEDREQEIFATKAIEDYVRRHEADETKGKFDFWHIPGTEFGTIKWQAVSGRFLVEAGPFDDTEIGLKFKEFFLKYPNGHPQIAPHGWGTSQKYLYVPGDREDGVYDWFEKERTTILPREFAANQYNPPPTIITEVKMNERQRQALRAIGGEELVRMVEETGEKLTAELEASGVDFKAGKGFAEQIRAVAKTIKDEKLRKQVEAIADKVDKVSPYPPPKKAKKPEKPEEEEYEYPKYPKYPAEKAGKLLPLGQQLRLLAGKVGGEAGKKLAKIAEEMIRAGETYGYPEGTEYPKPAKKPEKKEFLELVADHFHLEELSDLIGAQTEALLALTEQVKSLQARLDGLEDEAKARELGLEPPAYAWFQASKAAQTVMEDDDQLRRQKAVPYAVRALAEQMLSRMGG